MRTRVKNMSKEEKSRLRKVFEALNDLDQHDRAYFRGYFVIPMSERVFNEHIDRFLKGECSLK